MCLAHRVLSGCLAYLQVSVRIFEGITCASAADGSKRLLADLSLSCYADFPATAFFTFVFLFLYVIGFPIMCVYLVHRGTKSSRKTTADGPAKNPGQDLPDPVAPSVVTDPTIAAPTVSEQDIVVSTEPAPDSPTATPPARSLPRQSTAPIIHQRLHEPKRSSKYGFLYRGLKVGFTFDSLLICLARTATGGISASPLSPVSSWPCKARCLLRFRSRPSSPSSALQLKFLAQAYSCRTSPGLIIW